MKTDLLVEDEVHQRSGGVWDYVSPSRLNCWIYCPLKFKLRYIDGIRTPTTAALFLGKRVHAGLETFYRHRMLGITLSTADVANRMDESWDQAVADESMKFDSDAHERTTRQQAAELVGVYLNQLPDDEPSPLAVEARVECSLIDSATGQDLGLPMLGIVDLIMPGDDGPIIVDFKTSSRSTPPFEISHEVQLTSYAYLHRQVTGKDESGLEIRSLVKTKSPRVECHRYPARTEQHYRRLFCVIREYLDSLDKSTFNFRPSWSCGMCDFRDSNCQAWLG